MTSQAVQFSLTGILHVLASEPSKAGVFITLRHYGLTIRARGQDMAYTLPNDHQVQVQVSYVDAKGYPAAIDGQVVWASSDNNIASITVDLVDSTIATVVPGAQIGQAQITATADADLGTGVTTLITPMDVTVVGGQAVAGTIVPVGAATPIG